VLPSSVPFLAGCRTMGGMSPISRFGRSTVPTPRVSGGLDDPSALGELAPCQFNLLRLGTWPAELGAGDAAPGLNLAVGSQFVADDLEACADPCWTKLRSNSAKAPSDAHETHDAHARIGVECLSTSPAWSHRRLAWWAESKSNTRVDLNQIIKFGLIVGSQLLGCCRDTNLYGGRGLLRKQVDP